MRRRDYPVIDVTGTGQKIKKLMQENGLTVKDIQNYLHLSTPQAVYHWFDGKCMPTLDNLYALSGLFNISLDAMIVGTREMERILPREALARRIYAYYTRLIQRRA